MARSFTSAVPVPNASEDEAVRDTQGSLVARLLQWFGISIWYKEDEQGGRRTCITFLVFALAFVLLPFLFAYEPANGRLTVAGYTLPGACFSQQLLDADCPGCGLSRSFVCLAHGDPRAALRLHRLGPVLYLFLAVLSGLYIWRLTRPGCRWPPAIGPWVHWGGWLMILAILGNWVVGTLFCWGNGG